MTMCFQVVSYPFFLKNILNNNMFLAGKYFKIKARVLQFIISGFKKAHSIFFFERKKNFQ